MASFRHWQRLAIEQPLNTLELMYNKNPTPKRNKVLQ